MPKSPPSASTPTPDSRVRRRRASFSPALLEGELRRSVPGWPRCRLLVAFSGGADSVALLAGLVELLRRERRRGLELRALHVDHGLHPQSGAWARAARRMARALGVRCQVRRMHLDSSTGESLEARARRARYAALSRALRPGELLVTAHHEDDQAETLLLQLLRGAGVAGLAAMPAAMPFAGGTLLRPLLGVARADLRDWAQQRGLCGIPDPSNEDERFDRNFLRRRVVPQITTRWPQGSRLIARAAAHLGEARGLLAELGDRDIDAVQEGATLDIDRLRRLTLPRQRNLMRRWLERRGLPVADRIHLARILGELCDARDDSLPRVAWPGVEIRRWRRRLYAMEPLPGAPAPLVWRRQVTPELILPASLGRLRFVPDPHGPLALGALPRTLQVSFRAGGERLRTEPEGPTRRLKELLRAADVLPWMRDRIPLVHARERLIAVGDLWSNADLAPGPRAERRARLEWRDRPAVKS